MSLIDSLIGFLRGGGGDQETAAGIVADELSSGKALTDDPSVGQSKTSKLNSVYLRYPGNVESEDYPHSVNFKVNVRQSNRVGDTGNSSSGVPIDPNRLALNGDNVNQTAEDLVGLALTGAAAAGGAKAGGIFGAVGAGIAADSLIPDDVKSRISGLVTRSTTRKTVANITLAMTASPQNKMEAQWDSTDFGALGFLLQAGGLDNAAQLVKQGSATAGEGGEAAIRQLASLANIGKQLGLNIPLEATLELTSSKVLNPFKEQLFKTMNFRSFQFSHKFAPKNREELSQVMRIINIFERYMHPEKSESGLFLVYPAEFQIQYRYKGNENTFINRISDCALTGMSVDYGAGGLMTSFKDVGGAPSEITLNMEFKELVLRTRNEGSIRNLEADRTRSDSATEAAAGDGESEGTNTATSSEDNITESTDT